MGMSQCGNKVTPNDEATLINVVNEAHSKEGREGADQAYAKRVANAFGYSSEELLLVPSEARTGLSYGNPVALAVIKEGETVLDLGSGEGVKVFIAAAQVGPTGQVIGLDDSDDMITRARINAAAKGLKPPHVAFVKATLNGDLPIESNSVDCILSNCVFNLLPPAGKVKVMQEVYRILKPGGRVHIDDIIAKRPFSDSERSNVALYVGCISGAILQPEYQALMQDVGFKDALFIKNQSDLNVGLAGRCGTPAPGSDSDIGDLNELAKPYHIYARKSDGFVAAIPVLESALKNSDLQCEEVADLIRNPELGEKDFVVIDVREDDHAGGHIRGSVHQPAQAFYDDLSKLYEEHKGTKQVIFHCMTYHGRGLRYQDYLDQQGNTKSKAFVMPGGAQRRLSLYKEQEDLVDFQD